MIRRTDPTTESEFLDNTIEKVRMFRMYKILDQNVIAPGVTKTVIAAPRIAKKRKPGQFVILRLYEKGERIPLTIADADPERGTITIISQNVGKSTAYLEQMKVSDEILDVVGPLGHPTHIELYGHVVCIGGGIGIAPLYPVVQGMKNAGNRVTSIIGARTKDLLILEEEMRNVSDDLAISTDDGSYGEKGFVSDILKKRVESGERFDQAVVIGPVPMMRVMALLTKSYNIPTVVSLNSIMVDGTGMCGACRVTVDGTTKFTCVDGPEFDGFQVDFDELMHRLKMFDNLDVQARADYAEKHKNLHCVVREESHGDE